MRKFLVRIYFGRTASFVIETKEMPTYEAKEVIERLCDEFEKLKPYLVRGWNSIKNTFNSLLHWC